MFPIPGMVPSLPAAHQVQSFPAPIGGLNTRDSLAAMPATDSPLMINWIPDIGGVKSRKGTVRWATAAATVRSVFGYFGQTSTFVAASDILAPTSVSGFLFAATDSGIYGVNTAGGAPILAQALSGTAMAGHVHVAQLANATSPFLLLCSETDGYYTYSGTTWLKVTFGAGANQVSVVDPTSFTHVCVWKRRAWFVQRNTSKAAYLAVDSVYGAATSFDFGPLFVNGGDIAYITTWTIDAGEGIDDFLIVVSEMGDVLVYKGTDPASASTFALVGRWNIGPVPVGRRGHTKLGGDTILLSVEGLFPISHITRGGADFLAAGSGDYTSKIKSALSTDLRQSFTSYGWQMIAHPTEKLLMINVPNYYGATNKQYVMNTVLNAWTIFNDIPVLCMGLAGQHLFAGTADSRVLLLNFGAQDEVPAGTLLGNAINGLVQFPFTYLGAPAKDKQVLLARPTFLSSVEPGTTLDVSVDFTYENLTQPVTAAPDAVLSVWDTGLFDSATWDGIFAASIGWSEWESVDGVGFAVAAQVRTSVYAPTTLVSLDVIYQTAQGL